MNSLEVRRQLFHLVALSLWLIPIIYLPYWVVVALLLIAVTLNLAVVVRFKPVYVIFSAFIDLFERDRNFDKPGIQALYANLGVLISFLIFGKLAVVGVVTLAVGDSFSSLVGIHWGKHRIFYNESKSWEGVLAFFLGVYVVLMFFYPVSLALMVSVVSSLLESFKLPVDDNLTIPIVASAIAYLM